MFTIQLTTQSLKTAFFIKFKVLAFDVQSAKKTLTFYCELQVRPAA